MRTPEQYHNGEHRGPFSECALCRRAAGRCRQKIRFAGWAEAQEWVTEYHESRAYALPWQYRYCCRWCGGFHTATIRDRDRMARDRVKKQYRKWLIRRRSNGGA